MMGVIFKNIVMGYFGIGVLFALLLEFSWSWSLIVTIFTQFDVCFSVGGFIGLLISIAVNIILEPMIRAIVWLPSILSILSPDSSIGFMQWIFPGFYEPLISAGA